uniref:Serine protease n=1 Tax=Coptotermes formosanus TaxID=36987 RepID=R4V509_COPFO|nr:serine protease [Coptotermes formosanus]
MLSLHTIGGEFICGAVIISEAWALTAAHCTYDEPNVYVRAGSRRYDKADNEHDVIDKHEHHLFSPTTRDYDIALLKVLPRFRYTRTVGNIPFDEFEVNPGTDAIVSGWGFTETDGDYSDDLLFRVIPTIDKSKCEEYFPGKITPRMMCAGDTDGIGICEGDSGGPLVANGKLVGIVSWRADPCGSGVPDVYTKIAAVRGWISGISGV